ncbi:MAG: hypothetical protein V4577_04460 [Bacteroidota bacterium]
MNSYHNPSLGTAWKPLRKLAALLCLSSLPFTGFAQQPIPQQPPPPQPAAQQTLIVPNPNIALSQNIVTGDFTGNNTQIIDPIPFDKPFTLSLKIDTSIKKATLHIALKYPDAKKAQTLIAFSGGDLTGTIASGNLKANCNGLHPNRPYIFTLNLYSAVSAKQTTAIKQAAVKAIEAYLKDGVITGATYTVFKTKLTDQIAAIVGTTQLADAKTLQATDISDILTAANQLSSKVAALYTSLGRVQNFQVKEAGILTSLKNLFQKPAFASVLLKLNTSTDMADNAKKVYEQDLNDSARFKGISMGVMDFYLAGLADPRRTADLEHLITGKAAFEAGTFTSSSQMDIGFIRLLRIFLVKASLITWQGQHPAWTPEELGVIKDLADVLEIFDGYYKAYLNEVRASAEGNIISQFPDLFANYLVQNQLIFETSAKVDITASGTPYISLDAGIGYNHSFQSFFTNYGVNFYFTPVDKSVPLKTFASKPWLYILKTVSLNVSIVNNYFNNSNVSNRYVSLLGGNKDVFLGLGYRFSRVAKFNIGFDGYYLTYNNPQTTNKYFDARLCASLSLDINFINSFSSVGKAFGLLN